MSLIEKALRKPSYILFTLWILLSLLHLRPARLSYGYVYEGDDRIYLAQLSSLVIKGSFNYGREGSFNYLYYPVGSSLLALPGYAAGYALDRLTRNTAGLWAERSYAFTWTIVGYIMNQQVFVILGLLSFFYALRRILQVPLTPALLATIALLASHLPLYIFRRPIAHNASFMLSAFFCAWWLKGVWTLRTEWRYTLLGSLLTGVILATRWNNLQYVALGVIPLAMPLFEKNTQTQPLLWRRVLAQISVYLIVSGLVFYALQGPYWWAQFQTLWPDMSRDLQAVHSRLERPFSWNGFRFLVHVLVGADFGLLWTAPVILAGLLAAYPALKIIFNQRAPAFAGPLALLTVGLFYGLSFFIVMQWRTQASYYGYRYLTSCLVPSALFVAVYLFKLQSQSRTLFRQVAACGVLAIGIGFITAIPFEANPTTLTLSPGHNKYGGEGWINSRYTVNAWKSMLMPMTPARTVMAGPAGMPLGLYVASRADHPINASLEPLREKYLPFAEAGKRTYLIFATLLLLAPGLLFLSPMGRKFDA